MMKLPPKAICCHILACSAVEYIWTKDGHHYENMTPEQGACAAIRDGQTDVCSGTTYHDHLMYAGEFLLSILCLDALRRKETPL